MITRRPIQILSKTYETLAATTKLAPMLQKSHTLQMDTHVRAVAREFAKH